MKVLVLGGTGTMGMYLCPLLSKSGNSVYVTSRQENSNDDNITFIKGNAQDIFFLKSLLSNTKWDAIVDFMYYTIDSFKQRINLLLESTNQYVYISSSRVYADSYEPIKEDSPRLLDVCRDIDYLKTDEYALLKCLEEDILFANLNKNWTIVRPYITFGDYKFQLSSVQKEYWLHRALQGKTILFSQDIADKITTFTYGYDVARGIAALLGQESALGEAFHITSNEEYKWSQILDFYLDVIEKKKGFRPMVKILDKWTSEVGGTFYQVKYDRLYNRRFDNAKINNFIDTSTFKPTSIAIDECLSRFINKPSFSYIDWRLYAKQDRLLMEWSDITNITTTKHKIKYILYRTGLLS